jgi:hypothetical protein
MQIRQYMIENGLSMSKDDDDRIETALEIHQIQHNIIRTNRYRQIVAPEIRRNSTTSSVSGSSTMIIQRESDMAPNKLSENFVTPRSMVRPIQIKTEPIDQEEGAKDSPVTSSPSTSSAPSVMTIYSSNATNEKRSPPMVQINGILSNDSFEGKIQTYSAPAPLSVKAGRVRRDATKTVEKSNDKFHNLRTIKTKPDDVPTNKKKTKTLGKTVQRASPRIVSKKEPKTKKIKKANCRIVSKENVKSTPKRGRPPKVQEPPKKRIIKKKHEVSSKKS